jgi:3-deoxy-D-manno-octulosonic-acid transferase
MVTNQNGAHRRSHVGAALRLYRAAWEPALWIVRLCAGLEKITGIVGIGLWPARWRLAERLDTGSAGTDAHRNQKTIWLHAASLGECKGLWAFAQTLRGGIPAETRILLTANTTTGLDFLRAQIAGDATPADFSARLAPLDHPRIARNFLRANNVRALALFEVELWPHWIFAARRESVPVFWISARLTARARRRYAGNAFFAAALRRVLGGIEWIQAQTDEDAAGLRALGGQDVEVGGDLRGLYYLKESDRAVADKAEGLRRGTAFVSIHAQELSALVPRIAAAHAETPIRIFPRKMEELSQFIKTLAPHGFVLHSRDSAPDAPRVIVDSFGRVAETLAHARTVVVGGSFVADDRIGGHNLWEPLLSGARVEIGPYHANQLYLAHKLAEVDNPDAREKFIARESYVLKQGANHASERLLDAVNRL